MTGSVNFNPFLKNVQQVETPEQHKQPAAKPQVEQGGIISGDWQDEENYEIAIGEDNEKNEKLYKYTDICIHTFPYISV